MFFPCFSITWKNKGCLLSNFLVLNLSLTGITTEIGKFIEFPFIIMPTSLQSISKTSKIQFLLNLTLSMVNLTLSLNKCILLAVLFYFLGTYVVALDIKSTILVILENRCPLNKQDFLTLHMTR